MSRTVLLIIRAWYELDSESPLRAGIRLTCDTSLGFQRELTRTDAGAVEATVRDWLGEILSSAD